MDITSTKTCLPIAASHLNILFSNTASILTVLTGTFINSTYYHLFLGLLLLILIVAFPVWNLIKTKRVKDQQILILQSEINQLENNASKLVVQNDWLITEMHHRVKNNLQILSSLINSQLSFIKDKVGRDALFNSKHRLYTLSLVHQRLYKNALATNIEMSCCIKELVDYLIDEYNAGDRVKFELDLTPLRVDVAFAIPFGLIVNELATNSLKYAFPDLRSGNVKISLATVNYETYELIYADNGVGLPDDVDFSSARSLGRSLILGLSRQIKADVKVDNSNGLKIKMNFKAPQS
jgi:two-component sensor histidine kinase